MPELDRFARTGAEDWQYGDLANGECSSVLADYRDRLQPGQGSESLKLSSFGSMINRIGLGCVVLNDQSKVIAWNSMAKAALSIDDKHENPQKELSAAFKRLMSEVHGSILPGHFAWVVIPFAGGSPVMVHEKFDFAPSNESVVFLLGRAARPKPNALRLQMLFGLTGAETEVALNICLGHTLLEIAKTRKLSRTTVRSHLASLFAKTETNRQSELIALLNSMSVLP